jgi:hypothetical protein
MSRGGICRGAVVMEVALPRAGLKLARGANALTPQDRDLFLVLGLAIQPHGIAIVMDQRPWVEVAD